MIRYFIFSFCIFWFSINLTFSQNIYLVTNGNEIKVMDTQSFIVTDLFTVDIQQAGYLTDLAFSSNGKLYGVTTNWTLLEVDLDNETFSFVADLPTGDSYTALTANENNELLTSRYLSMELYSYNLDTGETSFIENNISSPGDFTFYKGNLVYPNIFNDFIKAYDGSVVKQIGCSVPLLYTFVNDYEDCNTNRIYGITEFGQVLLYNLETEDYEEVANIISQTGGIILGGATRTEYMASACPTENLETVTCDILSVNDYNPYGISVYPNPVAHSINVSIEHNETYFQFDVYDLVGKKVLNGILESESINLNSLETGVYFLRIYNERKVQVFQKQIVKR